MISLPCPNTTWIPRWVRTLNRVTFFDLERGSLAMAMKIGSVVESAAETQLPNDCVTLDSARLMAEVLMGQGKGEAAAEKLESIRKATLTIPRAWEIASRTSF